MTAEPAPPPTATRPAPASARECSVKLSLNNLRPGYDTDAILSERIGISLTDTDLDYTGPPLLNYSTNYQHALEFMAQASPQLRPISVYSWHSVAVAIVEGGGRVGQAIAESKALALCLATLDWCEKGSASLPE